MLATFVFPEFASPDGFLRARVRQPAMCRVPIAPQANRVVQSFANDGFVSAHNVEVVMHGILACLRDRDLPVRLEAAVALRAMLKDKSGQRPLAPARSHRRCSHRDDAPARAGHRRQFAGHFHRHSARHAATALLSLLRESDNDDLTSALDALIEIFGPELEGYAVSLSQQLVRDEWPRTRPLDEGCRRQPSWACSTTTPRTRMRRTRRWQQW